MEFQYNSATGGFEANGSPLNRESQTSQKPRKPIGSKGVRIAINLAVTVLFGLVYFYISLPALNLHAEECYSFVFLLCLVYCGCAVATSGFTGEGAKGYFTFVRKQCMVPAVLAAALAVVALFGALSSWVVLRANAY